MDVPVEAIVQERQRKVFDFLKKKWNWVAYVILAGIVYLAVWIRTRNVPGLKDVTTGDWTLGPDLDPFLFLRWAKYIVENGSLFAVDMMRYVPNGFETTGEYLLHPYMIAWFHNFFSGLFSWTVTQSAIYYPVFMFALTVIAFFLFVRKTFHLLVGANKSTAIALVASFFLSVMPALLPRTIAGIPEKESAAFFFMFMAFYLFLTSWESKSNLIRVVSAVFAGASTAAMGFIWGGYIFIFFVLSPTAIISFLIGAIDRKKIISFVLWMFTSFLIMITLSEQYALSTILASFSTGSALMATFIMVGYEFLYKPYLSNYISTRSKFLAKMPKRLVSMVLTIILLIVLVTIFIGPKTLTGNIAEIYFQLVKPAQTRLITTVAENRQPYFNEWASNFGPNFKGVLIGFWLFFIGSIVLVYNVLKNVFRKKEYLSITLAYIFFLLSVIFSRYAPGKIFDGENTLSLLFYASGLIVFLCAFGAGYYQNYKHNEEEKLRAIPFGVIALLIFFFLAIVGARGLVRLVMVLVPPASAIMGYFAIASFHNVKNFYRNRKNVLGVIVFILVIFVTVFAGYSLYHSANQVAESYIPSSYTYQWQKAMSWVRENTPVNSVFGHWWDYGYWVQSIGERATMLDGGNSMPYWNHLMGRYGLTGPSEKDALEFLYAHNTTHFLIDSTDIGKYGAFSAIGSDENYDRRSWIPAMVRDDSQKVEKKNTTIYVYSGGVPLDGDMYYKTNDTDLFLPGGRAALGAIVVETEGDFMIRKLYGIFVYQGQQYIVPIRYYYDNVLVDTGQGIDAGIFLMPRVVQNAQGGSIEPRGALLYLSPRVVHSQLARLYLYGEETESFKLAHTESSLFIQEIRRQGIPIGEIIFAGEVVGPIKIWEIKYPRDIEFKPEYLETEYPEALRKA